MIFFIQMPYSKEGHAVCKGSFDVIPWSWCGFPLIFWKVALEPANFCLGFHAGNDLATSVHPG